MMENKIPFLTLGGHHIDDLFGDIPTPAYVIDENQLRKNGEILLGVTKDSGAKILLAQKAFSNFSFYPLLSSYLAGTEASGLYEARLGKEEMGQREVHVFAAAYREDEFDELIQYADHIVFNSIAQLKKFGPRAKGKSLGLRVNPECSTQEGHAIYDPCAAGSRLGVTREEWNVQMNVETFQLLEGLHFHTLCEQDADALERTLEAVEEKFGEFLPQLKWLNMGGGHHITKKGYDIPKLLRCVSYAKSKWSVDVYLEPGEAVALNAGFLVCRVLDIVHNGEYQIAILDSSAACHMPDVIEMPYIPPLLGATEQYDSAHSFFYRLAGPTCLSGDIIGDYYFRKELQVGDLMIFGDMAIYTTCKNNTFNGMPLPSIWSRDLEGNVALIKKFGYHDFKERLGDTCSKCIK